MKEMNGGKQMKDVWVGSLTKPSEKSEGKHPTQNQNICWSELYWLQQKKDKLY